MENYNYQKRIESFQGESSRTWKRRMLKSQENFYKKNNELIDRYLWDSLSFDERHLLAIKVYKSKSIDSIIDEFKKEKLNTIREKKLVIF